MLITLLTALMWVKNYHQQSFIYIFGVNNPWRLIYLLTLRNIFSREQQWVSRYFMFQFVYLMILYVSFLYPWQNLFYEKKKMQKTIQQMNSCLR